MADYKYYDCFYNNRWYFVSAEDSLPVYDYLNDATASFDSIRKKYGIKTDTLKRRLRVMGYSDKPRRKYYFDETIFDCIDAEEKAYWLGFFLGGWLFERET